jgi:hypothetical protein
VSRGVGTALAADERLPPTRRNPHSQSGPRLIRTRPRGCSFAVMDGGVEHLTADQVEEDWKRALDTASEAVSSCALAGLLTPAYAAHETELIRAEREWLAGISATLRMLFPPPVRR